MIKINEIDLPVFQKKKEIIDFNKINKMINEINSKLIRKKKLELANEAMVLISIETPSTAIEFNFIKEKFMKHNCKIERFYDDNKDHDTYTAMIISIY